MLTTNYTTRVRVGLGSEHTGKESNLVDRVWNPVAAQRPAFRTSESSSP
jgi:hypothetical protein